MRYSAEHKAQSRARILEAARTLFRARGLDGASIEQVMSAAGLTRGAFYAHFKNREALVATVLEIEPGLTTALRDAPDLDAVRAILARYLSPAQREDVARNCAFVAHPADVRRGPGERRAIYESQTARLVDALCAAGLTPEQATEVAILTVGGAVLASAMQTDARADEVERIAQRAVAAILG